MRYVFMAILLTLWPVSAIAQKPSAAVSSDLHARADQVRSDWQHYWHDLDRPLEHEQDLANNAGDFAKAAAIGAQRAALQQQYETLVQQRIDDGHKALSKNGISRRYKTRKAKAKAEDAADFAAFLDKTAEGK